MRTVIIFAIALIFTTSCSNAESYDKIVGNWKGTSWINSTSEIDKANNNVFFEFKSNKFYSSQLGVRKDSGEYLISRDMLYVTPFDKLEFGVKIMKLTKDSLVFEMNLAGDEEILTLIREL